MEKEEIIQMLQHAEEHAKKHNLTEKDLENAIKKARSENRK